MQLSELSKEVQLLLKMTEVTMYEGLEGIKNLINLSDELQKNEKDFSVLVAKAFIYEQVIERMVISLYKQDRLWKQVLHKDIDYSEKVSIEHYSRIKRINKLADFQKVEEFKKLCNEFRKMKNNFAHSILMNETKGLAKQYKDLDKSYQRIYGIYSEQSVQFINKISDKLKRTEFFLNDKKDYSKDIKILKREASKIRAKKNTEKYMDELANLHQIYWLLSNWNDGDYSNCNLQLKFEILFLPQYKYVPMEEWEF